ncbi:hypothetical protein EMMF5_004075 [Cystobasidiomycetes sp. EMM_F5]
MSIRSFTGSSGNSSDRTANRVRAPTPNSFLSNDIRPHSNRPDTPASPRAIYIADDSPNFLVVIGNLASDTKSRLPGSPGGSTRMGSKVTIHQACAIAFRASGPTVESVTMANYRDSVIGHLIQKSANIVFNVRQQIEAAFQYSVDITIEGPSSVFAATTAERTADEQYSGSCAIIAGYLPYHNTPLGRPFELKKAYLFIHDVTAHQRKQEYVVLLSQTLKTVSSRIHQVPYPSFAPKIRIHSGVQPLSQRETKRSGSGVTRASTFPQSKVVKRKK